jgi:hypothetical protein
MYRSGKFDDMALVSAVDDFIGGSRWASEQFGNRGLRVGSLRAADTLRRDEWRFIQETLVEEGAIRIGLVDRLMSAGLRFTLPNPLGKTEIEWETVTDMQPAEVDMEMAARTRNDRVVFAQTRIPNPIVHKDFYIGRRVIEASRERGEPLPTTQMRYATRKVNEKIDDLALNGGGPVMNGNVGYGVLNHPKINTIAYSAGSWANDSVSGSDMVNDLISGMTASRDARHHGPWLLVMPPSIEARMGEDYSNLKGTNTIEDRLRALKGLQDILVIDQMPANVMVLIELQRDTVEIADGQAPQPVQWDEGGNVGVNFKVMAIRTLIVKADVAGRSGIVKFAAGS